MKGVDVHGSKGPVDWVAVFRDGFSFAWVKATEGKTFDDARFQENRKQAKLAGLLVGAYHYARPDLNSAVDEAKHFLRVAKPLDGELLPVLDFETVPSAKWALEWLRHVEKAIGQKPVFYTYLYFLNRLEKHSELDDYPLWLASYGGNDGRVHKVTPPAGFRMVAHQYTSNGRVSGVAGRVDCNLLTVPRVSEIVYQKVDDSWYPAWSAWRKKRPKTSPREIPRWAWRRLRR